jgi:hypothetical protein
MRFLCDGMLGTLCKYLRVCGYDAAYSNEGLKILIRAMAEDRTILTRNTRLKGRSGIHFIAAEDPLEQFRQVRKHFNLKSRMKYLSRCLVCNGLLAPVEKEAVRDRIPFYTYRKFDDFKECPACRKVYWRGSHYENMVEQIKRIMK